MAVATKVALTFQASGALASGSTSTGTAQDLTSALETVMIGQVTNGGTGPGVGCDFIVEVSNDNTTWYEYARATAGVVASAVYLFTVTLPDAVMYARSKFNGNTLQQVTVVCTGSKLSAIS